MGTTGRHADRLAERAGGSLDAFVGLTEGASPRGADVGATFAPGDGLEETRIETGAGLSLRATVPSTVNDNAALEADAEDRSSA